MKQDISNIVVVGFDNFKEVEPEDFIKFSDDYFQHVIFLKNFLKENLGKKVKIPVARTNGMGVLTRKMISGVVEEVENNNFTISTNQDFYHTYENPIQLLIRFDNVLGIIPLSPEYPTIEPLAVDTLKFKDYFASLSDMKNLMKRCINEAHAVTLFYRYSRTKTEFREGGYYVDCELIEVNRSNLKYNHLRTTVPGIGGGPHHYVDLLKREEIDRYIAPDRYLQKVKVSFGTRHEISDVDD